MDNETLEQVLAWGRAYNSNIKDTAGYFSTDFTISLRRALWNLFRSRTPGASGCQYRGYCMLLENGERIGVTDSNGNAKFRVFYHPATDITRRIARRIYQMEVTQ